MKIVALTIVGMLLIGCAPKPAADLAGDAASDTKVATHKPGAAHNAKAHSTSKAHGDLSTAH